MNVIDIMTHKPVTIRLDQTLYAALELMHAVGCHHLPVLGSDGHLLGVITDRDCRIALQAPTTADESWRQGEHARELVVRSVMTPAPIVVEPDTSAEEAARLMLAHRIGCLPVMRSETLIGIITKSDILMAFMNGLRNIKTHSNGQKS